MESKITYQLIEGDSLERLQDIADDSIDSVVTDPPYGLKFMSRRWDYDVPTVELWEQVLRVLKPGGHLLAFGGTRTYHRLVVNIEDAGFEIRDQIMWLYGSGMPHGTNISAAIDKKARRDYVLVALDKGMKIPGNSLHDWTKGEHSPSDKSWKIFKDYLTTEQWQEIERAVIGKANKGKAIFGSCKGEYEITAAKTDAAQEWEGWNTGLKPSNEPICLARKPISEKTVSDNVIKYGTGALNIGATKIGDEAVTINTFDNGAKPFGDAVGEDYTSRESIGRWPANVILDEAAGAALDEQTGQLTSGKPGASMRDAHSKKFHGYGGGTSKLSGFGDTGGASRFFYCAKASPSERSEGMSEDNTHPTVKPVALMRYLIRLVTPPGGTVLDPFVGSGTTGVAAIGEEFNFIGIDRDAEYIRFATARIERSRITPKQMGLGL